MSEETERGRKHENTESRMMGACGGHGAWVVSKRPPPCLPLQTVVRMAMVALLLGKAKPHLSYARRQHRGGLCLVACCWVFFRRVSFPS